MTVTENVVDEQKFLELFDASRENLMSAYECIRFLVLSAVRFGVTKDIFSVELQQLGFPREHSLALGKVLNEKSGIIKNYLKGKSLAVNELKEVKLLPSENAIECVKLQMKIDHYERKDQTVTKEINVNKSDIPILIKELKIIQAKMNELNYE